MEEKVSIFWFRRDLRLDDNVGLAQALKNASHVLPIFIFDKEILLQLPKNDARVTFIHQTLTRISERLKKDFNSSLGIYHGQTLEVFESIYKDFNIEAVYTNHDYEPYAIHRDAQIKEVSPSLSIPTRTRLFSRRKKLSKTMVTPMWSIRRTRTNGKKNSIQVHYQSK